MILAGNFVHPLMRHHVGWVKLQTVRPELQGIVELVGFANRSGVVEELARLIRLRFVGLLGVAGIAFTPSKDHGVAPVAVIA